MKARKSNTNPCPKCLQAITGESIAAIGKAWHRKCFSCTLCSRPFPDKKFYIHNDKPYCLKDYYKATNAFCGSCTRPIQGVCVDVLEIGKRFHQDCWRCSGPCGRKLTGIYYSYRGLPYCEADIDMIYRKSNPSNNSGRPERRKTLLRI